MLNFSKLVLLACTAFASASTIGRRQSRGSLQQVYNFGSNPTNVGFYIYVPNKVVANPGIVVATHYCTGTALAYYTGTSYKTLAEQYGFIVIYPESPHEGHCWDVSSQATLRHNGGGDSNAIVNMVLWTIKQYGADSSKVFATGTSSGAMMTNVLAAAYPDICQAVTVYAGTPAGCFYSASGGVAQWNATCATGQSINTPQVWAKTVRDMYPGYTGSYPPIQIYHGGKDEALNPQNYQEEIKQWTGIWGYDANTVLATEVDVPAKGWTRRTFGPNVQGIFNPDMTHSVPTFGDEDMKWFGFAPRTSPPVQPAPAPAPPASSGPTAGLYGQCGGAGYTGATACPAGSTCTSVNVWYSQCQ